MSEVSCLVVSESRTSFRCLVSCLVPGISALVDTGSCISLTKSCVREHIDTVSLKPTISVAAVNSSPLRIDSMVQCDVQLNDHHFNKQPFHVSPDIALDVILGIDSCCVMTAPLNSQMAHTLLNSLVQ